MIIAFGYEPCTIKDIKAYKPSSNSVSLGQVLHIPYTAIQAELIVKEMIEQLSLDLVSKHLITDQIVLTIVYDVENLNSNYKGETEVDWYGRTLPKHSHGTENLNHRTSSYRLMEDAVIKLYRRIVDEKLLVRKIYVVANNVVNEEFKEENKFEQMDLFQNYGEEGKRQKQAKKDEEDERNLQHAILNIKKRYGKNAVVKGMNLQKDGTMIQRNGEIGGHKA